MDDRTQGLNNESLFGGLLRTFDYLILFSFV